MGSLIEDARRRTVLLCDVAVVVWFVAWSIGGVLMAREVHDLRNHANTLEQASVALHRTAEALDVVAGLPLVGDRLGDLAASVDQTSTEMAASAADTRETVDDLVVLAPLCIGLIATVPVAVAYLPGRARRRRDRRFVAQTLASTGLDPIAPHLALRAATRLPLRELRRITHDPWGDIASGRSDELAKAVLGRLGLKEVQGHH